MYGGARPATLGCAVCFGSLHSSRRCLRRERMVELESTGISATASHFKSSPGRGATV